MRTISTVMLSGPPRRLARSTRKRHASAGGSAVATAPISESVTWPLRPSLHSRNMSPGLDGVRPLHVDLHQRLGAEAAVDDVAGDVLHLVGVHVLDAGVLPQQAVVVAELLDPAVADAVDAAVADVADPGAFRAQQQGGGGGAHALELAVGLAAGVDAGVGLDEGLAQGGAGRSCWACLR